MRTRLRPVGQHINFSGSIRRVRRSGALLVATVLSLAACAAQPSPSANSLTAEAAPAYYLPKADAVAAAAPGAVIESLEIRAPTGMRAWFVVYGSTGLDGQPVAVSGLVLAPKGAPPAAGWPVIAWAHGTTGIADRCAPSKDGITGIPGDVRDLVKQGRVVTATDYQGLGTEGTHPYLVGVSEGRSVLDSIRAAQALPDAHAGKATVVIGHSQGGHATIWAAELAPSYAPELDIRGAVATSPPADLPAWETWAFDQAAAGNLIPSLAPILFFGVWNETYGLPMDFLTDAGQQAALIGRGSCYPGEYATNPYLADPAKMAGWHDRLVANSAGVETANAPILVLSGDVDPLVDVASQHSGVAAMCAAGDTVEQRTFTGGHDAPWLPRNWPVALKWIADRFAGVAPGRGCA
jgi:pimeloyl-ACP methyl ester carboxylesterase